MGFCYLAQLRCNGEASSLNLSLWRRRNFSMCLMWVQICARLPTLGNIYVPKCRVDLSFNSTVILDFFLFWNCKLQNHQKNLGLNCRQSTYLALKGYYIHTRNCSQFWSKFKTRKSQGSPLSCNSSQLKTWAHKCHSSGTGVIISPEETDICAICALLWVMRQTASNSMFTVATKLR